MDVLDYGRGKAAELRRAVHRQLLRHELDGELPTSNRFIFYELRQLGGPLFGHASRGQGRSQDQNLSDASKWLRDHGLVPWEWIADETRSLVEYEYAETVADFLVGSIEIARIDCWAGSLPPVIICESRTFGGVLQRTLAEEYLCPVTATNGQVGGFLYTNIVPKLEDNDRAILYVGDFDYRGMKIEENTRRVLVHAAGDRDWFRVALTAEQVAEHNLPVIPKLDRSFRPPRTYDAVEVEALGQGVVIQIIRDALDALLPEPLADVRVREAAQQQAERDRLEGSS